VRNKGFNNELNTKLNAEVYAALAGPRVIMVTRPLASHKKRRKRIGSDVRGGVHRKDSGDFAALLQAIVLPSAVRRLERLPSNSFPQRRALHDAH